MMTASLPSETVSSETTPYSSPGPPLKPSLPPLMASPSPPGSLPQFEQIIEQLSALKQESATAALTKGTRSASIQSLTGNNAGFFNQPPNSQQTGLGPITPLPPGALRPIETVASNHLVHDCSSVSGNPVGNFPTANPMTQGMWGSGGPGNIMKGIQNPNMAPVLQGSATTVTMVTPEPRGPSEVPNGTSDTIIPQLEKCNSSDGPGMSRSLSLWEGLTPRGATSPPLPKVRTESTTNNQTILATESQSGQDTLTVLNGGAGTDEPGPFGLNARKGSKSEIGEKDGVTDSENKLAGFTSENQVSAGIEASKGKSLETTFTVSTADTLRNIDSPDSNTKTTNCDDDSLASEGKFGTDSAENNGGTLNVSMAKVQSTGEVQGSDQNMYHSTTNSFSNLSHSLSNPIMYQAGNVSFTQQQFNTSSQQGSAFVPYASFNQPGNQGSLGSGLGFNMASGPNNGVLQNMNPGHYNQNGALQQSNSGHFNPGFNSNKGINSMAMEPTTVNNINPPPLPTFSAKKGGRDGENSNNSRQSTGSHGSSLGRQNQKGVGKGMKSSYKGPSAPTPRDSQDTSNFMPNSTTTLNSSTFGPANPPGQQQPQTTPFQTHYANFNPNPTNPGTTQQYHQYCPPPPRMGEPSINVTVTHNHFPESKCRYYKRVNMGQNHTVTAGCVRGSLCRFAHEEPSQDEIAVYTAMVEDPMKFISETNLAATSVVVYHNACGIGYENDVKKLYDHGPSMPWSNNFGPSFQGPPSFGQPQNFPAQKGAQANFQGGPQVQPSAKPTLPPLPLLSPQEQQQQLMKESSESDSSQESTLKSFQSLLSRTPMY